MFDNDYLPISVATLMPTEAVGLNLYQQDTDSSKLRLYRGAEYPLHFQDLERLRSRGIHRLYIAKESRAIYQGYLRKIALHSASDKTIPLSARAGALNEVVRDVLETAFTKDQTDTTVAAADKLGMLATMLVTNDEFTTGDLFRVLHHDYATFTHSANVAFYVGMLAAHCGYSQEEIQRITTAGLLHDLGKLEIEEAILCKPGKLDENEFRKIRQHPLTGFKKLAFRSDLCEGQLMMVYQHHERLDGKGYPVGNVADEIHPWAKLCSVVDVYEALTSQRPYRKPMPRNKAIEVLERDCGTAFDPEVVECWKMIIQQSLAS